MKSQIQNPYLPNYEYVPDAEPRLFGDRVYIYGSHDKFDGKGFCLNDYITYSAPKDDLTSWRYEGVIFRKDQDPLNKKNNALYAPDCIKGKDGRYYLYYSVNGSGVIGVAVSDKPNGPFEYLSHVKYKDGTILGKRKGDVFQFDPGIYVEGDDVYLYSGFCPEPWNIFVAGFHKVSTVGPLCIKLESDMYTIKEDPHDIGVKCLENSKGTPYFGHEFFEASSLRKIRDKYYFIYSSVLGHELCYAISDHPDRDFKYGGTIVSIGDVGLRGIKGVKDAANFTGNTHGSILNIDDRYYIFYHRQTNRNCFSRQACAERIYIEDDGSIKQVEVTSLGLNDGPLRSTGVYDASIACNITCKKGQAFYTIFKEIGKPYLTQTGKDREENPTQYIANIKDGTQLTYKYFDFKDCKEIKIDILGNGVGKVVVEDSENVVATISVNGKGEYSSKLDIKDGVKPLIFTYHGKGKIGFISFKLL